jgi:hypothetical protein
VEAVDFILGPIYFLLIYFWAKSYSGKFSSPFLRKHFVNGLLFKLMGAIGVSLVYWYVYGGGDSIEYFKRSLWAKILLQEDLISGLTLLFVNIENFDTYTATFINAVKANEPSSFMVVRFATIANLFTFSSYLCSSFLFALLSYYGIWKAFRFFLNLYPAYSKTVAIAFLYIPSVAFWGSGIFKDNITFGFLCLLFISLYDIFLLRKNIIRNLAIAITSIYLIGVIKSYILMAFLPSFAVWLFLEFRKKISSSALRSLSTPIFIGLAGVAGIFVLQLLGSAFSKFSVDNFEQKASGMQRWHTKRGVMKSEEGSGSSTYSLGDVDFSATGIAKKAPLAIAVAIFRPFPWEVKSATMLLAALESLWLLYCTLKLLPYFFQKPGRFLTILSDNPALAFSLIFSLIFAFSVGFTSYNFGALSRYRIPFLPFYFMFVTILLDKLRGTQEVVKNKVV